MAAVRWARLDEAAMPRTMHGRSERRTCNRASYLFCPPSSHSHESHRLILAAGGICFCMCEKNKTKSSIPLHPSGPEIVEIFLCLFGSAPERDSGVGPLKNIPSRGNDAWQAGKFALVRPYDSTVISLSSRFMASATQDERFTRVAFRLPWS